MEKTFKNSKVKVCLTVDGMDWAMLKKIARSERSTASILTGQMIHSYILREKENKNV